MENKQNVTASSIFYPMRAVVHMTGLTADTIRVWERRYKAVVPDRTEGKTRVYSEEDVHRLILLSQAIRIGQRIGTIAHLSTDELVELIESDSKVIHQEDVSLDAEAVTKEESYNVMRASYLEHIAKLDTVEAERTLTIMASILKPKAVIDNVVLPILHEVGRRWVNGSFGVAQEHLASEQIKRLLVTMLQFNSAQPNAPVVIVTTPEGHLHELGALIGAILASMHGYNAVYLGPNLPEEAILSAVKLRKADLLLLSLVRLTKGKDRSIVEKQLKNYSTKVETWVGLPPEYLHGHFDVPEVTFFHGFDDFESALINRLNRKRRE